MANAKYRQTTWNGITVDYIEADMSTIRIKDLGGQISQPLASTGLTGLTLTILRAMFMVLP